MSSNTKQLLESEILRLSNNIKTLKALGADISEHLLILDSYRARLFDLIITDSNITKLDSLTKNCEN